MMHNLKILSGDVPQTLSKLAHLTYLDVSKLFNEHANERCAFCLLSFDAFLKFLKKIGFFFKFSSKLKRFGVPLVDF